MSFAPLPDLFLDEARDLAARAHLVLELGCGDGALTSVLRGLGLSVVAMDRARPLPSGGPAVLGDAFAPPVRRQTCDLLVAANLVRHLRPRRPGWDFLQDWVALLRPCGGLYVFEDAPRAAAGPAGNYGRLHELLRRATPTGRGGLLGLAECRAAARSLGLRAEGGQWENRWPLDRQAVLALLRRGRPRPGGEVAALAACIQREGIACGPAWWLRLGPVRG